MISINDDDISIYSGKNDAITKKYANGKWDFISFNITKPILNDKVVRKFIYSCINKREIIADILPGKAIESDIPIIPGTWLYEIDEWIKSLSDSEKNLQIIKKDSQKLLLEKGISTLKLEILVNEENTDRVKVAEKIAKSLNDNGFDAKVNAVKWDKLLNLVRNKRYDLAILGCTIPNYPDLSYIYSTQYMDYQSYNITSGYNLAMNVSGYENKEVENIIKKIYESKDRNEIKGLFSDLKIILNDEIPYIGLYFYYNAVVHNKNIRGNIDPYMWDEYNNITEWYISGQ